MSIKFQSMQAAEYTIKKMGATATVIDYKGRKYYLDKEAVLRGMEYHGKNNNLVFEFDFDSRELNIRTAYSSAFENHYPAYFLDCYLSAKYDLYWEKVG